MDKVKIKKILDEIQSLPKECYRCIGTDKSYYGECNCSYDDRYLIDLKKVKAIFKKTI